MSEQPVNHLLPTRIQRMPGNDWEIAVTGSITDEQAQGITWHAPPNQVTMGAFVQVTDDGGTRVGYIKTAEYHERVAGLPYCIVTIALR